MGPSEILAAKRASFRLREGCREAQRLAVWHARGDAARRDAPVRWARVCAHDERRLLAQRLARLARAQDRRLDVLAPGRGKRAAVRREKVGRQRRRRVELVNQGLQLGLGRRAGEDGRLDAL